MRYAAIFATLCSLSACGGVPANTPGDTVATAKTQAAMDAIQTDPTGRCFARAAGPTQTRIANELVQVVPEVKDHNGVVTTPAVFRNITRPVTETVGTGAQFETLCPQLYTAILVSTLQRAMIVRRAYAGPVNGTYDAPTMAAVRAFQTPNGVNSGLLSIETARQFGVVAIPIAAE